jgi:N-acylneuraminate cytidylyltransferase
MKFTAIIPVRAGSRRIPNKNLAPFGDSTLLENKIEVLKGVPEITKILVTSDSEEMLAIAAKHGADTHVRPVEYCDEKTLPFAETVKLVCSVANGEHIVWSPCTSPLVSAVLYSQAIATYLEQLNNGYDSLISVQSLKKFIWDDEKPLNYELGEKQVPSQQLPNWYIVTNGILIAPRKKMIEWKYTYGRNPYKFIVDAKSAVDIDEPVDLVIAETLLKYNAGRLPSQKED